MSFVVVMPTYFEWNVSEVLANLTWDTLYHPSLQERPTKVWLPKLHLQQQLDIEPDRPIGYGAFGVVWSVTDPRDGKRVALKKMPNVFQNLVSCKRVFRELKMLCFFYNVFS